MRDLLRAGLGALLLVGCGGSPDEPLRVAVATNFVEPFADLARAFEAETGHAVSSSAGSTGKLYAQIVNGAPFDLLLAADQARPARLERDGLAVAGSRFTYGVGRLLLWSRDAARFRNNGSCDLASLQVSRLAMANPALAPYGLAARQSLENAGAWKRLESRIVYGENIGQAYTLVATGNAEAGFIARSQVRDDAGSGCDIAARLHAPIRQDAVLLARAGRHPAAQAFMDFLVSERGVQIIEEHGYRASR